MNLDKFLYDFHYEAQTLHSEGRDGEIFYSCENLAVQALNSLGLAYCGYGKMYDKAEQCFYSALKIDPGNWLLWSNLTHLYSVTENHAKALQTAHKSIECSRGEVFDAYYNAGVVLTNNNRLLDSENMYRMAHQLNPNHLGTCFNLSLTLLRQGKFEEGWKFYDYRYLTSDITGTFKKRFLQDEWDGRKFKKKSLCIYSEQGLGDFIFFSRFIPLVQQLGGKVVLEVQDPLLEIVKDSFDGVEIIGRPNNTNWPTPPKTDYAISVCSLPRVLKIHDFSQINGDPYYKAPAKKKGKGKTKTSKKLKIGICWSGNADHPRDSTRSCFVKDFKPLIDHPKVECFSLVKGTNPLRKWPNGVVNLNENIESLNIVDLAPKINDFKDLISEIQELDLVVTVDTGLAHICGAIGKPVWVLIGKETDWRWMDDTETSPWYNSVRLFRYKGSWEALLKEVAEALPVK
jgi:tetratricopeptide (TPR) repeat protein